VQAFAVAEAIDGGHGLRRADLLRALGRNPKRSDSETADWKWLRRRLHRGRALWRDPSRSPAAPPLPLS
jgi:hypothetical protein